MESDEACWGTPVVDVDELRLPISFWKLAAGEGAIRDIQAGTVSLHLRSAIKSCQDSASPSSVVEAPQNVAPLVTLSPPETIQSKYRNDVQSFTIQKLRITSAEYPLYKPEFLNFAVKVKSFEPRVIEITAKSNILKDVSVGDYLSHANLYIQYKESPEESLKVHFFGNWREGHYSVIANYNLDENLLAVESDLKHIPLSQILSQLQKYNLVSKELNGRQVWISAKARSVTAAEQLSKALVEVRDIRLEGDLGDMRIDNLKIKSLDPFTHAPFVVDVQKMDVNKLLLLLNRPKNTLMLGSLGLFSGQAEITSDKKIKMIGEHSGLEFVFSNKGQQELQTIDKMIGAISLTEDLWSFDIQQVIPRGGTFVGNVKLTADRDFKDVAIKARIEELSLATPVQKLMTNGGDVGRMRLETDLELTQGFVSNLSGQLLFDQMTVEGLEIGKTKAKLAWREGQVVLKTEMASLNVSSLSPVVSVLRKITEDQWWQGDQLKLTRLQGELYSQKLKSLSWQNFQAQIGKSGRLSTDGAWTAEGVLKGTVTAREAKQTRRWLIEGTRELPQFTETAGSVGIPRK